MPADPFSSSPGTERPRSFLSSMAYPAEAGQDVTMGARGDGETVERQAAAWAARLDRGPLSPDEQHELEAWADADVRRQGALARALAMLALFDRPDGLDTPLG